MSVITNKVFHRMQQNGKMSSCLGTHSEIPCAWEVLPILVEGHGHDTVCGVECLLYAITMVNVNIYVKHSLMVPKARKDVTVKTMDQMHPKIHSTVKRVHQDVQVLSR